MSRKQNVVRTRRGVVVVQRRSAPVVGLAAIAAIVVMAVVFLPLGVRRNPLVEVLLFASFLLAAMRVSWRAMVRPRVEIREGYLAVYGFLERYIVPFGAVCGMETEDGLSISVRGRDPIPVFAFSGSLIDGGRTIVAAERVLRRAVGARGEKSGEVKKIAFDWGWADLVFPPFLIFMIVGILLE